MASDFVFTSVGGFGFHGTTKDRNDYHNIPDKLQIDPEATGCTVPRLSFCSYTIVKTNGMRILSRFFPHGGFETTVGLKRGPFLAHHLVLEKGEKSAAGPAWELHPKHQQRFMEEWPSKDTPILFKASGLDSHNDCLVSDCPTWKLLFGDSWEDNMNSLIQTVGNPRQKCLIRFDRQRHSEYLLDLIFEALTHVDEKKRWDVTFSTFVTIKNEELGWQWMCVAADDCDYDHFLNRFPKPIEIDLLKPIAKASSPVSNTSVQENTPDQPRPDSAERKESETPQKKKLREELKSVDAKFCELQEAFLSSSNLPQHLRPYQEECCAYQEDFAGKDNGKYKQWVDFRIQLAETEKAITDAKEEGERITRLLAEQNKKKHEKEGKLDERRRRSGELRQEIDRLKETLEAKKKDILKKEQEKEQEIDSQRNTKKGILERLKDCITQWLNWWNGNEEKISDKYMLADHAAESKILHFGLAPLKRSPKTGKIEHYDSRALDFLPFKYEKLPGIQHWKYEFIRGDDATPKEFKECFSEENGVRCWTVTIGYGFYQLDLRIEVKKDNIKVSWDFFTIQPAVESLMEKIEIKDQETKDKVWMFIMADIEKASERFLNSSSVKFTIEKTCKSASSACVIEYKLNEQTDKPAEG